ncbi:YcnI family protein [Paeniglutamicibacter sp. NPDC091659]|uniref:YcnI family copper-binding membrane protein n=1 Tax=Paeniglutamicibacter sp. NPDC091659 TaxID=3364389 RepID=UPI0037F56BE4
MKLRRTLLVSAATAGLMAVGLASASAHVTVKPDTTDVGAYSVLTVAASHGCEGSPTTSFTINIPESIADAKPTIYPGWDVKKIEEKLNEPLTTGDGSTITKHTGKIIYTAKTSLEDGYRMAFEIQVKNPDKAGEILAFPTLQAREKGKADWSQMPAAGQDPHELEAPAPSYTLTAATADGHHAGDNAQSVPASDNGASPIPGYLGLGAGVLGLVAGGIALGRTRKTSGK